MIVEILKDDKDFKIRKGFKFKAEVYAYDPSKITLIQRITKNGKLVGERYRCNQYRSNVKIIGDE